MLADNLEIVLRRRYPKLDNTTARQKAFGHDCGVSFSTVQRIMKQEVGASLDVIEQMSTQLQCAPYQLLTPYYFAGQVIALDPDPTRPVRKN